MERAPRPIRSELKSRRIVWEEEKPIRWSFMKILRETSNLKEFYPEIDPYVEAYKVNHNTWALYSESLDGAGDPWMYLIEGPQRAMLIDTSFGVGDLKGLVCHLIGDKELIVVNTHSHPDHALGNCQFAKVYCHAHEVEALKEKMSPHAWDRLFDPNTGKPIYTEFDRNDLIDFQPYEIIGVPDSYRFDLGDGYEVELIHMPGHSPGMCGYLDHTNHTYFSGDMTGIMGNRGKNHLYAQEYTVESQYLALKRFLEREEYISGVFPGHGMFDQSPVVLEYHLHALNAILLYPQNYDEIRTITRQNRSWNVLTKYIYQGSCIRYTDKNVYISQVEEQ